jgi:hypothetical protein
MDRSKKSRMVMLFTAVIILQCCCCIIPYSWSTRFDTSTFAAPNEEKKEINLPARPSLKSDAINPDMPSANYEAGYLSWDKSTRIIQTADQSLPGLQISNNTQESLLRMMQ